MLLAVCAHRTEPKENAFTASSIDSASLKSLYSFQNGVVVGDVDVVENLSTYAVLLVKATFTRKA